MTVPSKQDIEKRQQKLDRMLKTLEVNAVLKLQQIEELSDEEFETQLLPCYF